MHLGRRSGKGKSIHAIATIDNVALEVVIADLNRVVAAVAPNSIVAAQTAEAVGAAVAKNIVVETVASPVNVGGAVEVKIIHVGRQGVGHRASDSILFVVRNIR